MNQQINTVKKTQRFQILSGSALKIIAIVLMLIDHIGVAILYHGYLLHNPPAIPGTFAYKIYILYQVLRFIGRSAFPIFCFLLVEGFIHTSDRKKYAIRLAVFTVVSEIPFNLALFNSVWNPNAQNVFFTLLIGFIVIWIMDIFKERVLLWPLIMAIGMGTAYLLKTDYSYWGILLIGILYAFRYRRGLQTLGGCVSLFWEAPACLAFIPINMYNGRRGISLKYFFYLFYPLHLLLLAGIRYLFFGM